MQKLRVPIGGKVLSVALSSLGLKPMQKRKANRLFFFISRCMVLLIVALSAEGAFAQSLLEQPSAQDAEESYQLVWADEFNQDGPPDAKNWRFEKGFVRNKELQWYQESNARCKDGLLVIEARREEVANPDYSFQSKGWKKTRSHAEYTSSCISTSGLHNWTYGRFLVRAKIDSRQGLWPAIWTVGENGPWPECGEIDLMECYEGHLLANACWSSGKQWKPVWDAKKIPLEELGSSEWTSKFHIWRMDWNSERIELFVDDQLLNTINFKDIIDEKHNPFHEPHHLLLNLAVGGSKGGDPSSTTFPAKFEVDYVRVYKLKQ